jgi:hypothetical protein
MYNLPQGLYLRSTATWNFDLQTRRPQLLYPQTFYTALNGLVCNAIDRANVQS